MSASQCDLCSNASTSVNRARRRLPRPTATRRSTGPGSPGWRWRRRHRSPSPPHRQRLLPRQQVAKEALYWSSRSRAERGAMKDYTRRTRRSPRRVPRRIASPSEPARLHITRWPSAPHSGTNRTCHRLARAFHGPPLSIGESPIQIVCLASEAATSCFDGSISLPEQSRGQRCEMIREG